VMGREAPLNPPVVRGGTDGPQGAGGAALSPADVPAVAAEQAGTVQVLLAPPWWSVLVWHVPEVAPVVVVPQLTATAERPGRERNWRRVDAVMATKGSCSSEWGMAWVRWHEEAPTDRAVRQLDANQKGAPKRGEGPVRNACAESVAHDNRGVVVVADCEMERESSARQRVQRPTAQMALA
jgi:hypothetical protein